MNIFDRTMQLVERTMDLRMSRHHVVAANIANEETPGYRARELQFSDALQAASTSSARPAFMVTHARHLGPRGSAIAQVEGALSDVPAGDLPLDANSVNLELEMAKLADNALKFNTAASVISFRYRQLLSAIRETR
jgi:flagellar basal-body rod protein FlgB